jgi:hypothetical protein
LSNISLAAFFNVIAPGILNPDMSDLLIIDSCAQYQKFNGPRAAKSESHYFGTTLVASPSC